MGSNSRTEIEWMKSARKTQDIYAKIFNNVEYDEIESEALKEDIIFNMFGVDTLNASQKELADKIYKTIITTCGDTYMIRYAKLFVMIRQKNGKEGVEIVYKVQSKNYSDKYIDSCCRVYKDWNDYLKNNKLPKCRMCFPTDGVYSIRDGKAKITFSDSPSCDTTLEKRDQLSKEMNAISVGLVVASFFTPIGLPLALVSGAASLACNVYDIGRGIEKLEDMKAHDQDIDPETSEEAKSIATDIIISSIGALSIGGNALTRIGMKGVKNSSKVLKALQVATISTSCFTAGIGLTKVILNFANKNIQQIDIIYFGKTLLSFFCVEIVPDLAKRMIEKLSQLAVASYEFMCSNMSNNSIRRKKFITEEGASFYEVMSWIAGEAVYYVDLMWHKIECALTSIPSMMVNGLISFITTLKEIINKVYDFSSSELLKLMNKQSSYLCGRAKPLNIDSLNEITCTLNNTVEIMTGQSSPNSSKHKDIIKRAEKISEIKNSRSLREYSCKLQVFCEFIKKKFMKLKDDFQEECDKCVLNNGVPNDDYIKRRHGIRGNVNDFFFERSLDLNYYEEREIGTQCTRAFAMESSNNEAFHELPTGKLYPFMFDADNLDLDHKDYFNLVTENIGYKVNEEEYNIIKLGQNLTVLDKKDRIKEAKPIIYIYTYDTIGVVYVPNK